MSTDFTKFSVGELTKVRAVLQNNQGDFLLKQSIIKYHEDTFGSNYMDPVKCGYVGEGELAEAHEQSDQSYIVRANRQFVTILHAT